MLIELTGHKLTEGIEQETLSWIQKLIVKWFNIEYVRYYRYLATMYSFDKRVSEGDVLLSSDGTKWYVMGVNMSNEIFVRTLDLLTKDPVIGDDVTLYGTAHLEKRCETSEEFFKSN